MSGDESGRPARGLLSRLMDSQKAHARLMVGDLVRMRGLMPLLMKHRNG